MARKPVFKQMNLPFDLAELRKPVRRPMPPGLQEFAATDKLPDARVEKLAEVYGTIRGKKPVSIQEWRQFYAAVEPYFEDGR